MIEMKEYKEYDLGEKEYKMLKRKYNLTKILDYYFDCREQTKEEIVAKALGRLRKNTEKHRSEANHKQELKKMTDFNPPFLL